MGRQGKKQEQLSEGYTEIVERNRSGDFILDLPSNAAEDAISFPQITVKLESTIAEGSNQTTSHSLIEGGSSNNWRNEFADDLTNTPVVTIEQTTYRDVKGHIFGQSNKDTGTLFGFR
ncbi:hypothetical protein MIND_00785100 [Mycena indigotica]|uniref:Uncharacterized protein n=1 Tax=Mycena indigotica TaxID=2126181 RepID=A0A8H6SNS7_9AGAR|nr:uncharacterized protein MIND_00785100 [Mycena indigotica]KAF7302182.1 hypothetical protein MIND_00785100 [Mycena indigotica]